MRILTRYVLFDLIKVFLLVLAGWTALIFVVLMGKEAVDKGIGLGPLVRMAPYLLPQALQFAVPASMLLAATSVFGRMASYNEIVAIKSLGISPMVVIWPALALATFVSFVAVIMNDMAVSWGKAGMDRVVLESIEEVAYRQLEIHRSFSFGPWSINVQDVKGHRLIEPMIVRQPSDHEDGLTITAAWAELYAFPEQSLLRLVVHRFDVKTGTAFVDDPTEQEILIPFDASGRGARSRSPSNYALAEIKPAIVEQRQRIEQIEKAKTAQAAFAMLTGDFEDLSKTAWEPHQRSLIGAENLLHRFHTEPWRRWANGFSCLCFLLIGAPVAIRLRQSEFIASFFVCFLPILVIYYPLLAVSVDEAKDGAVPPQAVWAGNVVLALAGVWQLRRVVRY
ncbi:MAG: LptF/LptG family permease [Pirellulales bacterium]